MPDRSRIAGVPSVPAERTTRRRAWATSGFAFSVEGWKRALGTYSTPVARVPLCEQDGGGGGEDPRDERG